MEDAVGRDPVEGVGGEDAEGGAGEDRENGEGNPEGGGAAAGGAEQGGLGAVLAGGRRGGAEAGEGGGGHQRGRPKVIRNRRAAPGSVSPPLAAHLPAQGWAASGSGVAGFGESAERWALAGAEIPAPGAPWETRSDLVAEDVLTSYSSCRSPCP